MPRLYRALHFAVTEAAARPRRGRDEEEVIVDTAAFESYRYIYAQ